MTFSICVRERYESNGVEYLRFGVGITTRVACVGMQSPFASEHGAVSAQSGGIGPAFEIPNIDLRKKAIEYCEDGVAIGDAVETLMNVDKGKSIRQVHGVDANSEYAHTGEECSDWSGHVVGENFTVAGNLLAGEEVVTAVADMYDPTGDEDLGARLIEALEAGHEVGGDKREELPIHSAAIRIESTQPFAPLPYHHNVRVDATESPIEDLRHTYHRAREGYGMLGEEYTDPL